MSNKLKSIIKYQWVNILPTFISASIVLGFLGALGEFTLYLPICLGLIAGGVVDADNRLSGKVKNALVIFLVFLIAEIVTLYTSSNFYLLWGSSIVLAFIFIMSGAFNNNLKVIGFGGVLIICYSTFLIFHATDYNMAVEHLLWMLFAAVLYTIISLVIHIIFPNRGIKSNISDLYQALSEFLAIKGSFFDPDDDTYRREFTSTDQENGGALIANNYYNKSYEKARNTLIQQFETAKYSLIIRIKSFGKRKTTSDMLRYYLTADNIFKALDFNLQDYQPLKDRLQDSDIMFRIQRILMLFSASAAQFSYDLKSERMTMLDKRILLSIERLENSIAKQHALHAYHVDSLHLLLTKLKKIYWLFQNINSSDAIQKGIQQLTPTKHKVNWKARIRTGFAEFNIRSPIMRHAIRVCMLLFMSAFVFKFLSLQFAFWFMMAGVLVIQQNYSLTKTRVKHRVIGSIVGALLGATLAFPIDTMPVALCLTGITTLTLFQVTKVLNYGFSTMWLTMAVFCTFRIAGLELDAFIIMERIVANTLGALLCFLVMSNILPEWKYLNLGNNVRAVFDHNSRLYYSLVQAVKKPAEVNVNDLSHRYLTAHNAHLRLQGVVANIVNEPKIYRLYITPSIKLMALNDYILGNMSLMNQLLIESYENGKLNEVNSSTVKLMDELTLIFKNFYELGDEGIRLKVGEFVAKANELSDDEESDEAFNINFYLKEKIVGLAVAMINYRREIATIYQLFRIDEDTLKAKERSLAQARKETTLSAVGQQATGDRDKNTTHIAGSVSSAEEVAKVVSQAYKVNNQDTTAVVEAKVKETQGYLSNAAQNSISDICHGVNQEQVSHMVAFRLGQVSEQELDANGQPIDSTPETAVSSTKEIAESSKQQDATNEFTTILDVVATDMPTAADTAIVVPPTTQQQYGTTDAQTSKEADQIIAEALSNEPPSNNEEDIFNRFISAQELQMDKQIEQEVIWHDTADEFERIKLQEQVQDKEELALQDAKSEQTMQLADKMTRDKLAGK